MSHYFYFLVLALITIACSSDDVARRNPFLPEVNVNFQIDLNLPQYSDLKFSGNHVIETTAGRGIKGIIIYSKGNSQFSAFELSDPNIPISDCSPLSVTGILASSNCGNDNVYNIVTGIQTKGEGGYPLLRYTIRAEGNTLFITN